MNINLQPPAVVPAPDWMSRPDPPIGEIAGRLAALTAREPHEVDRSCRWPRLFTSAAPEPPGWR